MGVGTQVGGSIGTIGPLPGLLLFNRPLPISGNGLVTLTCKHLNDPLPPLPSYWQVMTRRSVNGTFGSAAPPVLMSYPACMGTRSWESCCRPSRSGWLNTCRGRYGFGCMCRECVSICVCVWERGRFEASSRRLLVWCTQTSVRFSELGPHVVCQTAWHSFGVCAPSWNPG